MQSETATSRICWPRYAAIAALCVSFIENLSRTWLKWGDLFVDTGRDLDVSRQVSEGKLLYSEVRYFYGPLAPWLNGLAFKLIGVHTSVIIGLGITCVILMTIVLYRLSRIFVSRLGAVAVVVAFHYICAFGHIFGSTFNFILPYSTDATYGILIAMSSTYFLIRFIRKGRTSDGIISLILLFLASLTKIELIAAVAGTHVLAQAGLLWKKRVQIGRTLIGYAVVTLASLAVYGTIYLRTGPALITDNLLALLNPCVTTQWSGVGGTHVDWVVRSLLFSAGAMLLVAAVGALAAHFLNSIALGAISLAVATAVYGLLSPDYCFCLLPLLAGAIVIYRVTQGLRRGWSDENLAETVVWTFALCCCLRILPRAVAYSYGFFLIVPSLVCLGMIWFRYLPRLLPGTGLALQLCGVGVFVGASVAHVRISLEGYARHTHMIQAPCADLCVVGESQRIPVGLMQSEVIKLLSTLPRSTRVLPLPEGLGLLFSAGLESPYPYGEFIQIELTGHYDDDALLGRLKNAPPDLVIRTPLVKADNRKFGEDYGRHTSAWIDANYEPAVVIGKGIFILILKRRDAPFPFPDLPENRRAKPEQKQADAK